MPYEPPASYTEDQDEKRRKIAEEIAQTEKNYVTLLLTMIEVSMTTVIECVRLMAHSHNHAQVIFLPLDKLNARLDRAQSSQTQLKVEHIDHRSASVFFLTYRVNAVQLEELHANTQRIYEMHSRFSDGLHALLNPWPSNCRIGSLFRYVRIHHLLTCFRCVDLIFLSSPLVLASVIYARHVRPRIPAIRDQL